MRFVNSKQIINQPPPANTHLEKVRCISNDIQVVNLLIPHCLITSNNFFQMWQPKVTEDYVIYQHFNKCIFTEKWNTGELSAFKWWSNFTGYFGRNTPGWFLINLSRITHHVGQNNVLFSENKTHINPSLN